MAAISIINGRIGRDAEAKDVSGHTVVEFSVAETTKRGANEVTTWYRVSVWDNYGKALQRHLVKGAKISVNGEFVGREYTDRDGNQRMSLEIRASEINVPFVEGESTQQSQSGDFRDDDLPF